MHTTGLQRRVVFVAGAHGVGKSTLGRALASKLTIPFYSAGDLLQKEGAHANQKVKPVKDIQRNQDVLVAALDRLNLGSAPIILDGHFCLLDCQGTTQSIPETVFKEIGLIGIILVEADMAVVQARMSLRDGASLTLATITSLQAMEKLRAEVVAAKLGVPLYRADSTETANIISWLKPIITDSRP